MVSLLLACTADCCCRTTCYCPWAMHTHAVQVPCSPAHLPVLPHRPNSPHPSVPAPPLPPPPQGLKPYEAAHKQLSEWRDELADGVQGALAGLLLGLGADALAAARIKVCGGVLV
jgi:hypothetical protein